MGSCLTFMYWCFMCQLRLYLLVSYFVLVFLFFSFFLLFFPPLELMCIVQCNGTCMFSSAHLNLPSCLEAEDT